jgi:hypothetical protein
MLESALIVLSLGVVAFLLIPKDDEFVEALLGWLDKIGR